MRITYSKDKWFNSVGKSQDKFENQCQFYAKSPYLFFSQKDILLMKTKQKKEVQRNRKQIQAICEPNGHKFTLQAKRPKTNILNNKRKSLSSNVNKLNLQRIQISKKSVQTSNQSTVASKSQKLNPKFLFESDSQSILFIQNDISFTSENTQQSSLQLSNDAISDIKINQINISEHINQEFDNIFKKIKIKDILNNQKTSR